MVMNGTQGCVLHRMMPESELLGKGKTIEEASP